ncbi:hypothetical protein SteCoe_27386 [Stentor coeruleus]|uniref:Uncharacterized protein n=1 Tax=Stentor coeruleus TaxID=5963 RepID=A0A1R2BAQ3_9CILI|nr:hypothetical protein SteCoe_27386 [Stentor coeruleus]
MYVQLKKKPDSVVENVIEQLENQGIFLSNHYSCINCAVVSDDLRYLVTGSGSFRGVDECSIRIWNLTNFNQVYNFKRLPKRVTHISISNDNSFIFAILENTSLYCAELWNSSPIKRLLESKSKMIKISILSKDYGLFLTHEGKFSLINFNTREILLITYYEHETNIECMALKNNRFAYGTSNGILNVCLYENSFVSEPFTVSKGRIKDINFDNEGKFLMFAVQNIKGEGKIYIWDVEAKIVVRKIKTGKSNVINLRYNYQLNILIGKCTNDIQIWDLNTGENFVTLYLDFVYDFFLVKSFLIVVMTGIYNYKNKITAYNIHDLNDFHEFNGHLGVITCIKIDKAKKILASASLDGKIFLWDLKTKKIIRKFLGHTEGVISLDFDDNHVYMASGSLEKSCRVWDFNTGDMIEVIRNNANWVTDVKIAPNCKFIAFACISGNTINVYDINKRKMRVINLIDTFSIRSICILENHKYAVISCEISKVLVLKL